MTGAVAADARPVTPLGILGARLADISLRAGDLDAGLGDELGALAELANGLDPYLERCTTPESPALGALADHTRAEDWRAHRARETAGTLEQEMLSGHVEGQFLQLLVHATRATRVLEIGMFTGYSALAMAEALPPDGIVVACELDPGVARFARDRFAASAAGGRIDVRVGPAQETLRTLAEEGEAFDVVFLDADKPGYAGYVDLVLDGGLLAAHGVLAVDNTLMQGQPWTAGEPTPNGAAIAAFNERLAADPRVAQVLLPLRDGLTLVRRVARDA